MNVRSAILALMTVCFFAVPYCKSIAQPTQFTADLQRNNVLPAVPDGPTSTPESAFGSAAFELIQLDPNTFELAYEITLVDLDTAAWRGAGTPNTLATNDDLAAIHIHFVPLGSGANKGTPHTMNILGAPLIGLGGVEDDLIFDSFDPQSLTTVLSGRWDAADVAQTAGLPAGPATAPMSDYVDELLNGELFMMIHTSGNSDGAFGGTLLVVPEPGTTCLAILAAISSCYRFCGRGSSVNHRH